MTLYQLEYRRNGSGFWENGLAGETLGAKKLVYRDATGAWSLADATAAATMPSIGITLEAIPSGKYGKILTKGYVGDASWSWTVGGAIFASATSGELTQTVPSTDLQQIIGYATGGDMLFLTPRRSYGGDDVYYSKTVSIPVESIGRPNTNPPTVVDVGNLRLLEFTLNTDTVSIKISRPNDWVIGGLNFYVVWTNDGGVDDNGKAVKVQMDYQTASEGDVITGSHANSPKTVEDTYPSATGAIEVHTDSMTIAQADFENEACIFCKFTFITPTGAALTCEPRMIGLCLQYNASPDR